MAIDITTSRYQRGISTLGAVELSLPETFALAARHGLDAVELRGLDGTLDLPTALSRGLGTPAHSAAIETGNIRVCALDASLKLAENTDADRAQLLALAPWADALGAAYLRVFDGTRLFEPDRLARALDTLTWWSEHRAEQGWNVDLMVETHDTLVRTPDILRFLKFAPAGTGLLWDSHHTWNHGNEDPGKTWAALRAHIVHIHVKDSVATPEGKRPRAYVPCGEGDFPMHVLREALTRDAFSGVVSLEWERHWRPEMPALETALSSAGAHAWW